MHAPPKPNFHSAPTTQAVKPSGSRDSSTSSRSRSTSPELHGHGMPRSRAAALQRTIVRTAPAGFNDIPKEVKQLMLGNAPTRREVMALPSVDKTNRKQLWEANNLYLCAVALRSCATGDRFIEILQKPTPLDRGSRSRRAPCIADLAQPYRSEGLVLAAKALKNLSQPHQSRAFLAVCNWVAKEAYPAKALRVLAEVWVHLGPAGAGVKAGRFKKVREMAINKPGEAQVLQVLSRMLVYLCEEAACLREFDAVLEQGKGKPGEVPVLKMQAKRLKALPFAGDHRARRFDAVLERARAIGGPGETQVLAALAGELGQKDEIGNEEPDAVKISKFDRVLAQAEDKPGEMQVLEVLAIKLQHLPEGQARTNRFDLLYERSQKQEGAQLWRILLMQLQYLPQGQERETRYKNMFRQAMRHPGQAQFLRLAISQLRYLSMGVAKAAFQAALSAQAQKKPSESQVLQALGAELGQLYLSGFWTLDEIKKGFDEVCSHAKEKLDSVQVLIKMVKGLIPAFQGIPGIPKDTVASWFDTLQQQARNKRGEMKLLRSLAEWIPHLEKGSAMASRFDDLLLAAENKQGEVHVLMVLGAVSLHALVAGSQKIRGFQKVGRQAQGKPGEERVLLSLASKLHSLQADDEMPNRFDEVLEQAQGLPGAASVLRVLAGKLIVTPDLMTVAEMASRFDAVLKQTKEMKEKKMPFGTGAVRVLQILADPRFNSDLMGQARISRFSPVREAARGKPGEAQVLILLASWFESMENMTTAAQNSAKLAEFTLLREQARDKPGETLVLQALASALNHLMRDDPAWLREYEGLLARAEEQPAEQREPVWNFVCEALHDQ